MSSFEDIHKNLVAALCKPGDQLAIELNNESKAHVLHMAVGISSEAGELLDCVKKYTIYDQKIDEQNLVEELGDIELYLEGLRAHFGLSRDFIVKRNIDKLNQRYGTGTYSDQQAQIRADKTGAAE